METEGTEQPTKTRERLTVSQLEALNLRKPYIVLESMEIDVVLKEHVTRYFGRDMFTVIPAAGQGSSLKVREKIFFRDKPND